MGQKTRNPKGCVSIINDANRIRLRWRFQKSRYSLNLFVFSKSNLSQARRIARQIEKDVVHDCFDTSLKKYKPLTNHEPPPVVVIETLVQHFEDWVKNYRNMDCERDIDYNSTRNMLLRWGKFDTSTVVIHLNNESFGATTYNRRLNLLKLFFTWTTKKKVTELNPLEDVSPKKVRRTEKPKRKPFTEEEIKRILDAFKNDTFCSPCSFFKHSHYYPFVYFCFKVGPRNGEAIGLRVSNVDITNNLVHIKEQLARTIKGTNPSARQRKDTKNGKHRVLPLGDDLKDVLVPLLENKNPDDLVFTSPKRLPINDASFQKRILGKILEALCIAPRNLYAARHTFGSRCIEAGLTPVMTAFLMGNSPQTALRNYTHQISLPSHLPKI
jgi:integrase